MSNHIISRRKIIKWARQADRDWDRDMNPIAWLEFFAADVQAEAVRKEREACARRAASAIRNGGKP
jgi:hypothetical protein